LLILFGCGSVALGITAIVCSTIVAALSNQQSIATWLVPLLSTIAALCAALITFTHSDAKVKAYKRARHVLDMACDEYSLNGQGNANILLEAMKKAEEFLSEAD
jgi:hypothetical protein